VEEVAGGALVYLGIVATFAVVSLMVCVVWLLIWLMSLWHAAPWDMRRHTPVDHR